MGYRKQPFGYRMQLGEIVIDEDEELLGQEILKQNKKEYSTYKLRFRFYDRTGKKTSDKISAWISTDNKRIPLKVEGKLPLGSMKAVYTGE